MTPAAGVWSKYEGNRETIELYLLLWSKRMSSWQIAVVDELWDKTELFDPVGDMLFYCFHFAHYSLQSLIFFLSFRLIQLESTLSIWTWWRRTNILAAAKHRITRSCQTFWTTSRSAQARTNSNDIDHERLDESYCFAPDIFRKITIKNSSNELWPNKRAKTRSSIRKFWQKKMKKFSS